MKATGKEPREWGTGDDLQIATFEIAYEIERVRQEAEIIVSLPYNEAANKLPEIKRPEYQN